MSEELPRGAEAARRVLRAARLRKKKKPRVLTATLVAVSVASALVAVALNLAQVDTPSLSSAADTASRTSPTQAPVPSGAPGGAAIARPLEVSAPVVQEKAPAERPEALHSLAGDSVRVRVLSTQEANALSGGRWQAGLRVANAVAGNHLGLRPGDVVLDRCARFTMMSEEQASVFLESGGECTVLLRQGVVLNHVSRVE